MMPTEEQLDAIKANAASLEKLNRDQLIMLALAELIACSDQIPIGKRIPLLSVLQSKAGIKRTIDGV